MNFCTGWDAEFALNASLLFCNLAETILGSSNGGFVVGGAAVEQLSHGGQTPSNGDGHSSPENKIIIKFLEIGEEMMN